MVCIGSSTKKNINIFKNTLKKHKQRVTAENKIFKNLKTDVSAFFSPPLLLTVHLTKAGEIRVGRSLTQLSHRLLGGWGGGLRSARVYLGLHGVFLQLNVGEVLQGLIQFFDKADIRWTSVATFAVLLCFASDLHVRWGDWSQSC